MKKIWSLVILFSLTFGLASAYGANLAQQKRKAIRQKIQLLKNERQILKNERQILKQEQEVLPPPPPRILPERVVVREREKLVRRAAGPELGLSGGLFGNIPSLSFDIWFHRPFEIPGTNIKTGVRYAQGEDLNKIMRKHALVFADGILHLNSGPGAIAYLGAGVNYLAYTTGQTSGTLGGEVYLGLEEGSLVSGVIYLEAGYGAIRTGFSPSYKGLNLSFGYKSAY